MPQPCPQTESPAEDRTALAHRWTEARLGRSVTLVPVAGDASFRRYFRAIASDRGSDDDGPWIVMDAPPGREDCDRFIDADERLRAADLHAPEILAADTGAGFLLLEDLGDTLLRDEIHTNNADAWFDRLFTVLGAFATGVDTAGLPPYNRERLLQEMELFPAWYLERHKGLRLSCEDWDIWESLCTRLIHSAHAQPQVFVHRDFHSCNLLDLPRGAASRDGAPGGDVGIIDFQDAVRGPVTYDLASLLWDRYIPWPRSRLEGWMESFRTRVAPDIDPADWTRYCDWMGLQRNLKIVGIFARLHYRDGKIGYLEMIPRFWGYLIDVLPLYGEFADFEDLFERLSCAP